MATKQNGLDDSAIDVPVILPKEVVQRVNALKNIQLKMVNIETRFYEELHRLECKYALEYEPLYDQRDKIISGEYEPNEEEAKWALDDDLTENKDASLAKDLETKATITDASPADPNAAKGIPEFWLAAMKSTDIIGEAIQEHDEPILRHLRDVRVKLHDQKPYGYTLEFHFNKNEFFTNTVLTKTYELTTDKDDKDPFSYDGPALYKSIGSKVDWVKGKDVTVKLIKKKQKHKSSGTIRVVEKEEKQDSFFNFFESPTQEGVRPSYRHIMSPNTPVEENLDQDEEDEELYEADFEIGHFFKEFLIPKAVLYYTGELVDENSFDEDYEDGEEEEEFDENSKEMSSIKNEDDDEEEVDDEDDEESKGKHKDLKKQVTSKHPKEAKHHKA